MCFNFAGVQMRYEREFLNLYNGKGPLMKWCGPFFVSDFVPFILLKWL